MDHPISGVTFDRQFPLPHGCLTEGKVECRVVRARCEITSFCNDLLAFRVILVVKITIHNDGLRCSFEREVVAHDCRWMVGVWGIDCKVERAVCRCRLRRGKVRCAFVVEVRFRGKGACECHFECVREPLVSGSGGHKHQGREWFPPKRSSGWST